MASRNMDERVGSEECKKQSDVIRQLKLVARVLEKPESGDSSDGPVGNSSCSHCSSGSTHDSSLAHTEEIKKRISGLNFGTKKRDNYLSWEDYFMGIALLSSKRSKDPETQVGACLVDEDNKIIGVGYNGLPHGCSDDALPWCTHPGLLENKRTYVCHAEVNAILNKSVSDTKGSTLYVTLFPCNECAKLIIQAGVRKVIYLHMREEDSESVQASRLMLKCAKVKFRKIKTSRVGVVIDFGEKPDLQ